MMPRPGQKYIIALAAQPNLVLDSSGNSMERCKLIIYGNNQGENQKWMFVPSQNGAFCIVNCRDQGTLEIPDYSQAQQGTQCHVAQPNGTINEMWHVQPQGQGVAILSAHNQMGLNVSGGQNNFRNEADVIIWPFSGDINEVWGLIPTN